MYRFGETLDIERDFTAKMITLHVLTPTKLCLLFGKDMRRQRHGYILNMSSVTAWLAYSGINIYGDTKCYLKHFSRGLHIELHDYGVNVTAVCPGAVDTDLYNLNGKRRRLLVRLGIVLSPEKLAGRAIHALFRGKAVQVPGLLNRLVLALTPLIPHSVIRRGGARRTNILPLHE
ncbi:SDR family NAD(P)-dependent oxidoreductase [Alistipes putredinis]|uniref:SDR family NAD(P)-dependent oxidoreductase n=1 Tax=Alistipes putredinis TaxID=28117 RepID=UPI0024ADFA5A|nr:SDR family NAD(P)-dependent oxidoreductase [Alistipes putredinis]